jgi:Uma2 family endonuclease
LPKRYFTPEEYLMLEEKAPYKSQYIAGEIFPMGEDVAGRPSAMGGAHPEHVKVATSIASLLYFQLRGRNCHVFSADLRVAVQPGEIYTYPDVTVLCGEPKYETARNPPSLLNPQVVCEVLSPSTEAFDRGDKFAHYRRLDSLTDCLLVATHRMHVEHYVRQEGGAWVLTDYRLPEQRVPLTIVGCESPLAEIYEKVTFPGSQAGA